MPWLILYAKLAVILFGVLSLWNRIYARDLHLSVIISISLFWPPFVIVGVSIGIAFVASYIVEILGREIEKGRGESGVWQLITKEIAMKPYFLPRRSTVVYESLDGEVDLRRDFIGYSCRDCYFFTDKASAILEHQREWHGWRKLWARLKES